MCICGTGKEDNGHFLLHCPQYSILHQDLFDQLLYIDRFDVTDLKLKGLILLGDQNVGTVANRIFLLHNLKMYNLTKQIYKNDITETG